MKSFAFAICLSLITFKAFAYTPSIEEGTRIFIDHIRDADQSDVDLIKKMLREGLNPNFKTWGDTYIIHDLSSLGYSEDDFAFTEYQAQILDALLKAGADPYVLDDRENPSLKFASNYYGGHLALKVMVENGVDIFRPVVIHNSFTGTRYRYPFSKAAAGNVYATWKVFLSQIENIQAQMTDPKICHGIMGVKRLCGNAWEEDGELICKHVMSLGIDFPEKCSK